MGGKMSGFDPYKEEKDKRSYAVAKEKKSVRKMFDRVREELASDPRKKIFASQKGGQERKRMSGKHKVSLPTLDFLKEQE